MSKSCTLYGGVRKAGTGYSDCDLIRFLSPSSVRERASKSGSACGHHELDVREMNGHGVRMIMYNARNVSLAIKIRPRNLRGVSTSLRMELASNFPSRPNFGPGGVR